QFELVADTKTPDAKPYPLEALSPYLASLSTGWQRDIHIRLYVLAHGLTEHGASESGDLPETREAVRIAERLRQSLCAVLIDWIHDDQTTVPVRSDRIPA